MLKMSLTLFNLAIINHIQKIVLLYVLRETYIQPATFVNSDVTDYNYNYFYMSWTESLFTQLDNQLN